MDDARVYQALGELTAEVRAANRRFDDINADLIMDRANQALLEKRLGKLENSKSRTTGIATAAIAVLTFIGFDHFASFFRH